MFDIVRCKDKHFASLSEDEIFREINQVISAETKLEAKNLKDSEMIGQIEIGVPLIDIILNINLFAAHFEDRSKVLTIIKEMFSHCNMMKRLL
jgi:hypothetical protein